MIIAIDGPAASGKGTIGRKLAALFGLAYLDTGAIYRAAALAAQRAGVDFSDAAALEEAARGVALTNLDDPALRTAKAGAAASRIAAVPGVRTVLIGAQRAFARQPGGAVLDGRDIGTVVCPDADVKLFVTATPRARAQRRAVELRALGHDVDEAELARDLAERDARDRERAVAPMRPAAGAQLLDTSEMSIDAAFDAARRLVDAAFAQANEAADENP